MKARNKLVALIIVFGTVLIGCFFSPQKPIPTKIRSVNPNTRNDSWGFIGPGGGGAMFSPAINPQDGDHVFVSCDMTGSFVTYDGGENWRMFNLRGVVKNYTFDPSNQNRVYAHTRNILYKSEDRGTSWHVVFPRNIITINARGDHASEVVVTEDSLIQTINKMVIAPENPERLLLLTDVQAEQSPDYSRLLTSEDGGEHWLEHTTFESQYDDLFIDPTSSLKNPVIYVTSPKKMRVHREGKWQKITLPQTAGTITQFTDGIDESTNNHVIYALSGRSYFNPKGKSDHSGVFKTIDGGNSWSDVGKPLLAMHENTGTTPEFRSIATCYTRPNHIYISYANLQISTDSIAFGVAKSTDQGQSWELVWKDVYVNGKGIPSSNRLSGWLDQRFGPGWGENPFHMAVAQHDPELCYTTDFGRTFKTSDGGNTWQQVYTRKHHNSGWSSRGLQVTTGYMIAFNPFDSLHCFLADTDTGLMESLDGGKSWTSATHNNGVPGHWVNTTYWMVFDPKVKGRVWAAMSQNHDLPRPKMWRHIGMEEYKGGIVVSNDHGKTWKPVSGDIGEVAVTHVILDKNSQPEQRTLYACAFGKGVYKSLDGGLSWQQKNKGIEKLQPAAWRIGQKSDGELLLTVFRKSDDGSINNEMDGALYRSVDGAETWQKIALPEYVNGPSSILADSKNEQRLILAAWGRRGKSALSSNLGGGIYLSENNGKTWQSVLTHDQHIHDVTIDLERGVFYAAGFNSSAYRSEDRGRTWQRIKGYNFKWGKRVQPDPYDPDKIYVITFGGGVWHGPAIGDPNALEDIVTPKASY